MRQKCRALVFFPHFSTQKLFWHFVANSLGAVELMTCSCRISFLTLATAVEPNETAVGTWLATSWMWMWMWMWMRELGIYLTANIAAPHGKFTSQLCQKSDLIKNKLLF